jgi:hypothetical protein
MTEHNLFYYPYASFTNLQLPLFKVAALYFDKLFILDPVGASWDSIGAEYQVRTAVELLRDAGIVQVVSPADVLARYESELAAYIRHDMGDQAFLDQCDAHSRTTGKQRWTLSLAKVPQDLQADQAMRHLLGNITQDVAHKTAYATNDYIEHIEAIASLPGNDRPVPLALLTRAQEYGDYARAGMVNDAYREGYTADVAYRSTEMPLALGESIMVNHALFAGLLHANATPITDDPFHNRILAHKLNQSAQLSAVRKVQEDRARQLQLRTDLLVAHALRDTQLQVPVLNPNIPLEAILEYRRDNADALGQAREKLGWMARRIVAEPWSAEFANELERQTIPDIADELDSARRVRDAWLSSQRGRHVLSTASVTVGAASALLTLFAAPLTPIALATAGLALVSGAVIPGAEWVLDWRNGARGAQENGLHYLLHI